MLLSRVIGSRVANQLPPLYLRPSLKIPLKFHTDFGAKRPFSQRICSTIKGDIMKKPGKVGLFILLGAVTLTSLSLYAQEGPQVPSSFSITQPELNEHSTTLCERVDKLCPFCNSDIINKQYIHETECTVTLYCLTPATKGNILIIPKRHIERFEQLTEWEMQLIQQEINLVSSVFTNLYGISEFVLLQKNGKNAGQRVAHLHFHMIPAPKPFDEIVYTAFHHRERISADEMRVRTQELQRFLSEKQICEHSTTVCEQVENRWSAFQRNREFTLFEPGKPDALLEKEFENISSTRSAVWTTSDYKLAEPLITNDLIRAPGCVAFAYNNTVPDYNASTIYLNGQYHIACEGPRSKDIQKFFNLLTTQQVTHLVRLTDSYEGDIKKCHPYWEGRLTESSDGRQYLNIQTTNGIYSIRAFDMAYWRDNQGVDPEQLLAFVLQVKQELKDSNGSLLVHCSAGVGRTGTFLAASAIVDAIDQGESFSIEEIIYRLSLQRVLSVGKSSQYITLHRLAESYSKEKQVSSS